MSSRSVARLGDITEGTCFHPSHKVPQKGMKGKIITASGDVITNKRGTARIGDTVLSDCGHKGRIVTGKDNVLTNTAPTARIGDKTEGDYIAKIISGSDNVYTS